jgi:hypothetical protein
MNTILAAFERAEVLVGSWNAVLGFSVANKIFVLCENFRTVLNVAFATGVVDFGMASMVDCQLRFHQNLIVKLT